MLAQLLPVGLGGFLGAVTRYLVGHWLLPLSVAQRFPWPTFVVNVSGCLLIGVLAGLVEKHGLFSPALRLFLFTGLLGGYTTFSAFGLESIALLRRGDFALVALYAAASVVLGLLAVWLGLRLVFMLSD